MGKPHDEDAATSLQEANHNPFAELAQLSARVPTGEVAVAQLLTPEPPEPGSPYSSTIVIQRERKGHGGKTVTVIRGIDAAPGQLERTASQMRQAFGCGGHVDENMVVLAGNQGDRAAVWLKDQGAKRVILGN